TLRAVCAADDDDVGVLCLVEGCRHRARGDAFKQRGDRRRMAKTRAVVDIVCAKSGTHEFLENISLLVRRLGGPKAGQGFRAVAVTDLLESGSSLVERFLPGRLAEMR